MSDLIKREDAIKATWQEPSYTDPLNVLTEVRDRINALPTIPAPRWHRVEERLPDDSRDVIIFTVSKIIGLGSLIGPNWYQWYSGGGLPVDVTHWMPLPEPPKEDA